MTSRHVDLMYAQRRSELTDAVGAGVVLVPTAPVAFRNGDVEHDYRQDSDFYYLTGLEEPRGLLLLGGAHPDHRSVLFLRDRDPARERWDGPRLGVDAAVATLGVDAAYPIETVEDRLPEYLANAERVHFRFGRHDSLGGLLFRALETVRRRGRKIGVPHQLEDLGALVDEMRLRKRQPEIERMKKAIAISTEAHLQAMRSAAPGRYEYEIEAELAAVFRARGSKRPAYGSIVGSGPNATVLHHRSNDRRMEDGDLLLIDAGCEFEYYASDLTRTYPVNGKFSRPQAEAYEVVLRAQLAAIDEVKPGATLEDVHQAAVRELTAGLIEMGLIAGPLADAIDEERYKPFYMHRTSHWLGMDVHDVGAYYAGGKPRPLEPGFVLTIEPGLYVAPDADVGEQWRGLGIRIEDDVLVTQGGCDNLSAGLVKDIAKLEQIMGA